MASPELVSVVVPAYNHARYVRECLTSLAAQTHRPLELIIGDDASSDGTVDEVRSFLRDHGDAFKRVVFEERDVNGGIGAMLNHLLAHARGRYVFVCASDDRAAPHAIETLAAILDADPHVALAVGDNILIDSAGRRAYWGPEGQMLADESTATYRTWVEYLRAINRPAVFEPRLFGRAGTLHRVNYIPNGYLLRRSAVLAVGGWRSETLEDWDLNFRLACRYRLRFVDEPLFAYRRHESNLTNQWDRLQVLHAATEASIARQLRNPAIWLRVMADRDIREGLRARLRRPPARG